MIQTANALWTFSGAGVTGNLNLSAASGFLIRMVEVNMQLRPPGSLGSWQAGRLLLIPLWLSIPPQEERLHKLRLLVRKGDKAKIPWPAGGHPPALQDTGRWLLCQVLFWSPGLSQAPRGFWRRGVKLYHSLRLETVLALPPPPHTHPTTSLPRHMGRPALGPGDSFSWATRVTGSLSKKLAPPPTVPSATNLHCSPHRNAVTGGQHLASHPPTPGPGI